MKDASRISVQGMIMPINNQVNCFQTITLTNNVNITFCTTKIKLMSTNLILTEIQRKIS